MEIINKELENRIKKDFGESANQAIIKINNYLNTPEWINHEKVVYAILNLSNKDINKLDKYIKIAMSDPRDVIMLADEM
jgi:hypothetical protein